MSAACYRGGGESSFCAETLSETISFGRLIRDVCYVSVYWANTYFPARNSRAVLRKIAGRLFNVVECGTIHRRRIACRKYVGFNVEIIEAAGTKVLCQINFALTK